MPKSVLLDSGFLIRLMNPEEVLHQVALDVFKNYVTSGVVCKVSTIALAVIQPRVIIPNDTKMFAQASSDSDVFAFVSADAEAKKVYDLLENPGFEFVNIRDI
jgi:predicted nucleic acid-binding protein